MKERLALFRKDHPEVLRELIEYQDNNSRNPGERLDKDLIRGSVLLFLKLYEAQVFSAPVVMPYRKDFLGLHWSDGEHILDVYLMSETNTIEACYSGLSVDYPLIIEFSFHDSIPAQLLKWLE